MTIQQIRDNYVTKSGFTGGWNVILDTFEDYGGCLAVSAPVAAGSWLVREMAGLAREVELGGGMSVLVIEDWAALERRVNADTLRERLLVMITGNLSSDDYRKALSLSGRTDGRIRRSVAGVPVGAPYWYPTEEQLSH